MQAGCALQSSKAPNIEIITIRIELSESGLRSGSCLLVQILTSWPPSRVTVSCAPTASACPPLPINRLATASAATEPAFPPPVAAAAAAPETSPPPPPPPAQPYPVTVPLKCGRAHGAMPSPRLRRATAPHASITNAPASQTVTCQGLLTLPSTTALLPRCACGCNFLGISGDPPGDNCNHQKASRTEQKLPRSLWDLVGTRKKRTQQDRYCTCN